MSVNDLKLIQQRSDLPKFTCGSEISMKLLFILTCKWCSIYYDWLSSLGEDQQLDIVSDGTVIFSFHQKLAL